MTEDLAAKAPRTRGFGLAWRLAVAAGLCAPLFIWRIDIGTTWVVGLAILYVLHRVPRTIRRFRAGDWPSTTPWLVVILGMAAAFIYQNWAQGVARDRFRTIAAAIERDPCRVLAVPPAESIQVGLLDYPVHVRRDEARGSVIVALYIAKGQHETREFKLAGCARQRGS